MAFRDDREALRAKGEALESEMASLRQELERTKRELEAHKEVDRLAAASAATSSRTELGEDPARRTRLVVFATLTSLAVTGVIWLVVHPDPTPHAENRGIVARHPSVQPEAAPVVEAAPNGLDAAQFGAVVMESTGEGPAVGDGCVLDAELQPGGDVGCVRLFCAETIYDSRQRAGTETTMHDWSFVEAEAGPAERVYSLRYRDTGMRTGVRPEIIVDTARGEIRVTRAADADAPPFTALLRVEEWSTPRVGGALAAEATPATPAPSSRPVPERCELSGGWEGRLRTPDREGARVSLAPVADVVRVGAKPMWWSPLGGSSEATIALACEEGRATVTAADAAWEGRFGPDGATFLGRRSGAGGPVAFWLRRLGTDETSTVPTTSTTAIMERALRDWAQTAARPTGTAMR